MDNQTLNAAFTHNGKFTIQNRMTGEHRTFRVRTQKPDASFAPGLRVVALLTGADNEESYTGFGFMEADGITVWTKRQGGPYEVYARMLWTLVVDGAFSHYADRYAILAETVCRICNRTLTEPESIRSGIGPVCASRIDPQEDAEPDFERLWEARLDSKSETDAGDICGKCGGINCSGMSCE